MCNGLGPTIFYANTKGKKYLSLDSTFEKAVAGIVGGGRSVQGRG